MNRPDDTRTAVVLTVIVLESEAENTADLVEQEKLWEAARILRGRYGLDLEDLDT